MRTAFGLAMAASIAVALFAGAPARAADLYTVKGVHVDQTAKSSAEARTIAQGEAQSLALADLLKRLTLPEDWPSLPQVDGRTASDAVRGFAVASEKTSSTRYIADLNVSFQPETVRRMLRARNIPYGETQAKPAVLLAVLDKGGARILWEDQNPWRDAWAAVDIADAMTPLVMPMGDVQEFTTVTGAQAVAGDKAALAALAARYGADSVVVAHGVTDAAGTKLDVTVTRYDPSGPGTPIHATFQAAGAAQNGDAFMIMAKSAASSMLLALGEPWKRETVVRAGEQAQLTASVFYSTLDQWEAIRKAVGNTPLVESMQIEGIAANGAEVDIRYRGMPDTLVLSLAQSNVALAQDADGWSLHLK
ncbi:DUF2066 domain-containing protein [Parvibaculum sedimenti]|uniref:DUF2066 domain-containing protein n=1 Tax=Parvibaculum sedimenti TaxID=2608632 RepID=A0A6N6VHI9_9HYPH|nr:DUF2066 domain-containing protein [Parvibaculum sedimenti]KAB7740498.1 DUF2066 domain-containing protein [Parvibaculum sedimenti]